MDLAKDAYSLTEFFVKPTDDRGHGDKVAARVPPDLARLIDIIVSSRKYPYRTSSDVLRDFIWRGCSLLAPDLESPEASTILAKLRSIEETLKLSEAGEKLVDMVDGLGLRLLAIDDKDEKKRVVTNVQTNLEEVKSDYWRKRSLKLIRERYGEYLD